MTHSLEYIGDIIPEDFKVIGFSYLSPIGQDDEGRMEFELEYEVWDEEAAVTPEIEDAITTMALNKRGRCNHCNAHIAYIYIVYSLKTGTVHTFGSTCGADIQHFSGALIANAQEANMRKRKAIKREAIRAAILANNPGLAEALQVQNKIIQDIAEKFRTYDTISPKQIELVFKMQIKAAEWKAAREEEEKNRIYGHHFTDGARLTLQLKKFGRTGSFESNFGTTYIENYIGDDNRVYKYMGSTPPDVSADEFVTVAATIKHDNYKGPETKLQRIKVKSKNLAS